MQEEKTSYERRNARLIATKIMGAGLAASLAFSSAMPAQAFAQDGKTSNNKGGEGVDGSSTSNEPVLKAGNASVRNGVILTVEEAQNAADKAQEEFEQIEAEYNNAVADSEARAAELESAKKAKEKAEQELAAAKQATPDASAEAVSNANVLKEDAENAEKASSVALTEAQTKYDEAKVAYEGAVGRQTAAQNALSVAQSELVAAEASVAAAQAEVTSAQAALTQAQEESQAAGATELKEKLDEAQAALDASIAAKNSAAAQVGVAQNELTAATTEYEACLAAQNAAQTQVDNASATAIASSEELANAKTETQSAAADLKRATDAETAAKSTVAEKQQILDEATARVNTAETNKAAADALVAEKEQALANARATSNNIDEARAKGLVGMLDWMLTQDGLTDAQKTDVTVARAVLNEAMNEDFSKYPSAASRPDLEPGRNNKIVAMGFERDAINLDNVKKSLQIMRRINEVRAKDNNFVGYNPAKVNFYFMAGAAAAANRGARTMTHTSYVGNCEGLAWGWDDPVVGWCDKEKIDFDKIRDELGYAAPVTWEQAQEINRIATSRGIKVGHYIYVFYAKDQVMGVGFNQYSSYGKTSEYCATAKGYNFTAASYTVDEFEAILTRYISSLDNSSQAVQEAQAALDAAKTQQVNAANEVTTSKEAKKQAAFDLAEATTKFSEAAKAAVAAEEVKNQKQQAEADAQKKADADQVILANAQRILQEKAQAVIAQNTAVKKASSKLEAEKTALSQAEAAVEQNRQVRDQALANLSAVDQVLADAQKAFDTAKEKLVNAQSLHKIASDARDAAQTEMKESFVEASNRQQNLNDAEVARNAAKADNDIKKATLATAAAEADRLTKGWKVIQEATNNLNSANTMIAQIQSVFDQAQAKLQILSVRFDEARRNLDTALADLAYAMANPQKPQQQPQQQPQSQQQSQQPQSQQQAVKQLDTGMRSSNDNKGEKISVVQTGDENDAVGLGVLAALSSAALATFANKKRKKSE